MSFEYRLPVLAILAVSGLLFIVFLMPPLTSSKTSVSPEFVSEAQVAAIRAEERAFCEAQPEAVDCQCFAQKSGVVRSHSAPRVPAAVYADQQELARGQASATC